MHCAWTWDCHSFGVTSSQFHPSKVSPLTTLPRSRMRDSATVTPTPGDGTTAIKVDSSHNWSAYFPQWKKSVGDEQQLSQNTANQLSWYNINHFTPTTIHHNVLWSVWWKLCQYRQHRTSNTHRAELIVNYLMVNPIKSCTEINLHDSSLLPTLQWTLQCMGRAQNASQVPRPFL